MKINRRILLYLCLKRMFSRVVFGFETLLLLHCRTFCLFKLYFTLFIPVWRCLFFCSIFCIFYSSHLRINCFCLFSYDIIRYYKIKKIKYGHKFNSFRQRERKFLNWINISYAKNVVLWCPLKMIGLETLKQPRYEMTKFMGA